MNYIIDKPKPENLAEVQKLLLNAKLPAEDIGEHWDTFLTAGIDGEIIGAVGLEIWKERALLRSLVVKDKFRNHGIGKELYNKCIDMAKHNGIVQVGLLTTTAEKFFSKQGFEKVANDDVPDFIKQTKEFLVYCPNSSTVMVKTIEREYE